MSTFALGIYKGLILGGSKDTKPCDAQVLYINLHINLYDPPVYFILCFLSAVMSRLG